VVVGYATNHVSEFHRDYPFGRRLLVLSLEPGTSFDLVLPKPVEMELYSGTSSSVQMVSKEVGNTSSSVSTSVGSACPNW
jgi:hypothetical protein